MSTQQAKRKPRRVSLLPEPAELPGDVEQEYLQRALDRLLSFARSRGYVVTVDEMVGSVRAA